MCDDDRNDATVRERKMRDTATDASLKLFKGSERHKFTFNCYVWIGDDRLCVTKKVPWRSPQNLAQMSNEQTEFWQH